MSWSYLIVLDQGTHSTRAIIYNHLGESIFKSQQEIDLIYHNTVCVEQDGKEILRSCKIVLDDAHQYIQNNQLKKVAVALTTQRSTVIAWNAENGNTITPALSWLDTRGSKYLSDLSIEEAFIKQKTGLPLSPHYGASKLKWLLEQDAVTIDLKNRKNLIFGPLAAYLIFNLVQGHPNYVDYSNAHRTLLWNLETSEWDDELLAAFNIDINLLPKVVPNEYRYGLINKISYPLVLVNGDQNSAVYGYGKLDAGTSFVNIGTGAFVLAKSEQRPKLNTKLLASITFSSNQKQEYALEGTVNGAGAAMSWAEDTWGFRNIEEIEWKNVSDVPIFINTIGGLGSPFWESGIQPRFLDENKTYHDYSKQQCMAALMESIAFLLVINIEEMKKHGVEIKKLLLSGGMSKDHHLCQCLANISSVTVMVSSLKEATSRGAAWLAFQQPDWKNIAGKEFYPNNNEKLLKRYTVFKQEMMGLVS